MPYVDVVHDRVMVEALRAVPGVPLLPSGDDHRPVRERDPELLKGQIRQLIEATGYDEISSHHCPAVITRALSR